MKFLKNLLINTLIFLLVFAGGVLVAWHFIQGDIIPYFTHVPIDVEAFEENYQASIEDAIFDPETVSMAEAFEWLEHINILDDLNPIGELILPSINITLPIFLGVGEPNISVGAGTVVPDIVMGEGNYVLASHWSPTPGMLFRELDQIQVGDILILRNADYVFIYETIIGDNYIIEPYRWDITEYVEGKTYLTLFTCTPDGTQRVKVRGELVEKVSVEEIAAMLASGEDNLTSNSAMNTLVDNFDLDEIVEAFEVLNADAPNFPIVGFVVLFGAPALLAIAVVWISSNGFKKKGK